MNTANEETTLQARRDIRELILNLEAALEEVGDKGGITADLRENLLNTIAEVKEQTRVSFVEAVRTRANQVRDAAVAVDGFVTHYPWTSVLLAVGTGWLAHALFTPRRSS